MGRSRKPEPLGERSLACLIQCLEGSRLVIELRNDVIVKARLDSADEYMNMMLSNATMQMLEGSRKTYEIMYLKGRLIRFVHLPQAMDPAKTLAAQRQKIIDARLENLKHRLRNPLGRLSKDAASHSFKATEVEQRQPREQPAGEATARLQGTEPKAFEEDDSDGDPQFGLQALLDLEQELELDLDLGSEDEVS